MALIICKECGKEISDTADACPHCGYKEELGKIQEKLTQPEIQQQTQPNIQEQIPNQQPIKKANILNNKSTKIAIGIVLIALIVGISIATIIYNKNREENLPIKVDISMTSYYGHIDYILDKLGLKFDLVTMGANCYTGVQRNEFSTKKYGILHTEFRYCASNKTQIFRVYNDEKDQPLREAKEGELATFDVYGQKTSASKNSF